MKCRIGKSAFYGNGRGKGLAQRHTRKPDSSISEQLPRQRCDPNLPRPTAPRGMLGLALILMETFFSNAAAVAMMNPAGIILSWRSWQWLRHLGCLWV